MFERRRSSPRDLVLSLDGTQDREGHSALRSSADCCRDIQCSRALEESRATLVTLSVGGERGSVRLGACFVCQASPDTCSVAGRVVTAVRSFNLQVRLCSLTEELWLTAASPVSRAPMKGT